MTPLDIYNKLTTESEQYFKLDGDLNEALGRYTAQGFGGYEFINSTFSNSIKFNGIDSYVLIGTPPQRLNNFTYSFIVRSSCATSVVGNGSDIDLSFEALINKIAVNSTSSSIEADSNNVGYVHVVFTASSTAGKKLYINGSLVTFVNDNNDFSAGNNRRAMLGAFESSLNNISSYSNVILNEYIYSENVWTDQEVLLLHEYYTTNFFIEGIIFNVTPDGVVNINNKSGTNIIQVSSDTNFTSEVSVGNWMTINNSANGCGGFVEYSYEANLALQRTGILTISTDTLNTSILIVQDSVDNPITLLPDANLSISGDFAELKLDVFLSNQSYSWTATSDKPWLRLINGTSGTGDGLINYIVDENIKEGRTATITVTESTFGFSKTLTIYQDVIINKSSNLFYRIFNHLLPRSQAWKLSDKTNISKFINGLIADLGGQTKSFFDSIFENIDPYKTDSLDEWETQFNLQYANRLTDLERRDRLSSTWRSTGGQDPFYIQNTLQDAGFDVYVHEWWTPGTEPQINSHAAATPRNPLEYLESDGVITYLSICGGDTTVCGDDDAVIGNTNNNLGYPLVNKIYRSIETDPAVCGSDDAVMAGEDIVCGNFDSFIEENIPYTIPTDPQYWSYFLYIGGESFPSLAQVHLNRRNEFEDLCLKICPCQQWLGILVQYV